MKNVADIYALTPLQQLMLAQSLARREAGLLVEQFQCTLTGPLVAEQLHVAAEAVVARHPLLRACFAWEGLKQPVQVVREKVSLPWIELDWRDQPAEQLEQQLAELKAADRQAGFQLTKAPLTRFHLIRTGEQQWYFVWTCHHLLLDGWSAAVVLKELFQGYSFAAHQNSSVADPAGSFGEYLAWLKAQDPVEADQFWQTALRGISPASALPVEFSRRPQSATDCDVRKSDLRLSTGLTTKLNQLAAENRVGLNTILQAAWAILLAHYSSSSEVVFGIAVSGRPPRVPRVESIVGPLMNNIPLRAEIDWTAPLPALLGKLQAEQAEAQPHEHWPLERIGRAAGFPADRRMFDSLLVFENYPLGANGHWRLGELEIANLQGTTSSNYPLTLIAIPHKELELRLEFDTQRFSADTAYRLLQRLATLLGEMAAHRTATLGELKILDIAELDELSRTARACQERVLDAAGHCAPLGMPGEIWTSTSTREVAPAAASQPGASQWRLDPFEPQSKARLRPTGYRGAWMPDGTIEWLGRQVAPAQIGAYRIDPAELTAILKLHPLVADGVIVARADAHGAEQLAAFVVATPDAATILDATQHGLLFEQLQQFLKDRVPETLVPRIWRTIPALPRNASGAVNTEQLPAAFRARGETSQPYVAPRDRLEERLCEIWSEVLGVEPVGVEDDFLDLGGHSSLAVTMSTRLEAAFGRQWSLASLLEKPTVAQLAMLMRKQPTVNESSSLVPIRAQGSGTPLFCVHPAGGTVMCYRELARHLDAEIPVYGLQAQGIDDDRRPLDTIPEMAAAYLQAIQTVQPHGPYQLCGWSTGGIIAFEVARQLAALGESSSLVAMIDAAIPRSDETFGEEDIAALLAMLFPGEDLSGLKELGVEAQLQAFSERAQRANLLGTGATSRQANRIYQVFQANMQGVSQYQPGPLEHPLTIIRASQQATPMHADPHLGWLPWAQGGIEVRQVAATHMEMLQQPAVLEVAEILAELLSQVTA